MPELPEVQTVINHLNTKLPGQTVEDVVLFYQNVLQNCDASAFKQFLVGEKIESLSRRGKYILIHLTHHKLWLVHLRMEGKLFALGENDHRQTFPNLVMRMKLNHGQLIFLDSRHFGTFHILSEEEQSSFQPLAKVAIDPLNPAFNEAFLASKFAKNRGKIKPLLLDQSVVSGIGNIYADEILFYAGVHPERPACSLTPEEITKIVVGSQEILRDSIAHHGTTIHSFAFSEHESGGYQAFLKIHGRNIKTCPNCHTPVKFTRVGGRGTYYCPHCQVLPTKREEKDD